MPSNTDLTDVPSLKQYVRIATDVGDDLLDSLVVSCSSAFANMANRSFGQATITETRNGQGGDQMMLRFFPVTAVSLLQIDVTVIPPATGPTILGYYFDDNGTLTLRGWRFTRGRKNVVVSYTYGYPLSGPGSSKPPLAVPPEYKQAVNMMAAFVLEQGKHIQLASENLGGMVASYSQKEWPPFVQDMIEQASRRHWVPA